METLREIIRGIALIIIFAGFMEMILPDNENRRYIQLVVGLFVIVSIITPLAQLVNKEKSFEVVSWQYVPEDNTKAVLEKGSEIAKRQENQIKVEADKRVAAQVTAIAKLHSDVDDVAVELLNSDDGNQIKIRLTVKENVSENEKLEISERVSETIAAFFGYSKENIDIGY